jgi:hypothetical protein
MEISHLDASMLELKFGQNTLVPGTCYEIEIDKRMAA